MKLVVTIASTVVLGLGLAGCTILGSEGGKGGMLPAKGGSAYSLPKALLNIKLSDVNGNLVLDVGAPEYIADEEHTYLLQYRPNSFSSDTVDLTIDPKTNLLQTVSGTAEDKTSLIILEIAKFAAMIAQAAPAPGGEIVIFERKIDPAKPTDVDTAVKDMNIVATGHAKRMYANTGCVDSNPKDPCASYRALLNGANISFTVVEPAPHNAETADCTIGVCYRAPAPYRIEFTFDNQYRYGTVVNLPNNRPALALPLDRTAFVRRVDSAEFENGMLKKAHFEKPSEALEIASLPERILTTFYTTMAEFLQLKVNLSDLRKKPLRSRKKTCYKPRRIFRTNEPLSHRRRLGKQTSCCPEAATAVRSDRHFLPL